MTAVNSLDELLGPDPGEDRRPGDRWYVGVTTERALRAAERRHETDMRRRYHESIEWADYSVYDLRLPWTQRQANVASISLIVSMLVTLAGVLTSSTVLVFGPCLVSVPVTVLVLRDLYRRVSLWLLDSE